MSRTTPFQEVQTIPEMLRSRRSALTAEDLAGFLAISQKTVYALAKSGRLPSIRFGSTVRFDPAVIADWLEEHQLAA